MSENEKRPSARNLSALLANNIDPQYVLLTDADLAQLTGRSPASFAVGRCRGTLSLPFIKLGKSVRCRLSDYLSWIQDNSLAATQTLIPQSATMKMDMSEEARNFDAPFRKIKELEESVERLYRCPSPLDDELSQVKELLG